MESPYSTTSTQSAASFFYYTPDTQSRPKHHGHFLPHPQSLTPTSQLLAPSPISPMSFPSQLVYGGSNSLQSSRSLAPILSITPSASPSLQQNHYSKEGTDMYYHPTTPPLSHSAVSTPALTHAMLTPMSNHGWSAEEPSCGTIAPFEMQLPGTPSEWAESPEYAPLYVFPPTTAAPPSILVNNSFCPALSPSSSQTSSAPDLDFCDPRHLTFSAQGPVESDFGLEFPTMLSFEQAQPLGSSCDLVSIKTEEKNFNNFGLLFEDDLAEFDSEDDHWSRSESQSSGMKRQRVVEDVDYETDADVFDFEQFQSRHESCSENKSYHEHGNHMSKSDYSDSEEEMTEVERLRSFKFGSRDEGSHRSSKPSGQPINPNVIRRGRKQSLTEDPSKTFVCHLCNRRFRRQEHLKRHFRSLHTEDKPFSCGECGKKFSRSDNLTQHARIHGSGAILLGVLEENEVMDGHHRFSMPNDESSPLGIIVLDPSQTSESKAAEEKRNRRKRRRNEE